MNEKCLNMNDIQEADKFWAKLGKACTELQYDFNNLSPQSKQVIMERVKSMIAASEISLGVNDLNRIIRGINR